MSVLPITFASRITEETIPHIIEEAARWELNVTDDLDGVLDDPTLSGDHYAILSFRRVGVIRQAATFTTMWGPDFSKTWKYIGEEQGPAAFRQVQKI